MGAVVMGALSLSSGTDFLHSSSGDNDSLLRMVQVRDLIAGQGWFDLTQYRMGLDGGFVMHWSRIVDAPIAAIVVAGTWLSGSQPIGEAAALILWPILLFASALFLVLRSARLAHGESAMLPALVTGGTALYAVGVFSPGIIDHHNFQLVLTLAMAWGIIARTPASGLIGGGAAAASLAIGAETMPYVALGGAVVSVLFLQRGRSEAGFAAGFGAGFSATALATFVATVPARHWLSAACDSYSVAQFAIAIVAGAGLVAVTRMADRPLTIRAAALATLGGAVGALLLIAFPQCVGDPFADMDPLLRSHWLDMVTEAQSVVTLVVHEPESVLFWFGAPVLALAVAAYLAMRGTLSRGDAALAALIAGAVAVASWQVRGGIFSVPLAAILLSGWIARIRSSAMAGGAQQALTLSLAWLLSNTLVWGVAGDAIKGDDAAAKTTGVPSACYNEGSYEALARLEPATVSAISNLGASILKYTPHRALAGPYHRNVAGNLANLRILLSPADEARRLIADADVAILAVCLGSGETKFLVEKAPDGLLARLAAGDDLPWLQQVSPEGEALHVYGVRP